MNWIENPLNVGLDDATMRWASEAMTIAAMYGPAAAGASLNETREFYLVKRDGFEVCFGWSGEGPLGPMIWPSGGDPPAPRPPSFSGVT